MAVAAAPVEISQQQARTIIAGFERHHAAVAFGGVLKLAAVLHELTFRQQHFPLRLRIRQPLRLLQIRFGFFQVAFLRVHQRAQQIRRRAAVVLDRLIRQQQRACIVVLLIGFLRAQQHR